MDKIVWFATELRPRGKIGKKPKQEQLKELEKWLASESDWVTFLCKKFFGGTSGTVHIVIYGFGTPFATFTINPDGNVSDFKEDEPSELVFQPDEDRTSAIFLQSEIDNCSSFREIEPLPTELKANCTIGTGDESVYVYTTIADQNMGWVKIGRTSNEEAVFRIYSQFNASNSTGPDWLLHIHTEDSAHLEKYIHDKLKAKGRHINKGGGTEWFRATVEEVEEIYHTLNLENSLRG